MTKYTMSDAWERLGSQKAGVCYYCGIAKDGEVLMELFLVEGGVRVPIKAHFPCAVSGKLK